MQFRRGIKADESKENSTRNGFIARAINFVENFNCIIEGASSMEQESLLEPLVEGRKPSGHWNTLKGHIKIPFLYRFTELEM